MGKQKDQAFPLLDYLDGLVEDLRQLVPKAIRDHDEEAVHDARVSTRRLKAAVELMRPVLSDRCRKPFGKVTKNLRQQLGPLRDLDVMVEHLGEMKTPSQAAGIQWLKERLQHCRDEASKEAETKVPPARVLAKLGTWWGLRQEIVEATEAVPSLLSESVHLQLDAFAEQADELVKGQAARRAGRAGEAAGPTNDPHQLRIAGKSLRYTLEMAREHGRPLPPAVMSLFKKLQEYLGIWHDYVVLTERMLCETVDCDLALHDPALQGQILALAQATLKKAQVNLNRVADVWAEKGETLSRQIREFFPLTKSVPVEGTPQKNGKSDTDHPKEAPPAMEAGEPRPDAASAA